MDNCIVFRASSQTPPSLSTFPTFLVQYYTEKLAGLWTVVKPHSHKLCLLNYHGSTVNVAITEECNRIVCYIHLIILVLSQYQGYESFSFLSALGRGASILKKYKSAVPYLNSLLTKAMLYTFDDSLSSFETIEGSTISAEALRVHVVPVILDTPLCVFVWLPRRCWEDNKQKNAFSIAEVCYTD